MSIIKDKLRRVRLKNPDKLGVEGRCFDVDNFGEIPYFNHMPRRARIDAPGALHHIVIRGIKRKAIFNDDTDREDFIERFSRLLQDMDADAIGPVRGHRRCVPLSWYRKKELARRFNADRSAISRASLRASRDPELPAATNTIQREPETNQHRSNVPFIPRFGRYPHFRIM